MSTGIPVPTTRRWWKRLLLVVIAAAVAGTLLWQGLRHYIHAQSYIPLVAAALTDSTGLPASIEALDVTLFPTPQLTAKNVVLGGGDFKLEVAGIRVHVRLSSLLHRELDITPINARPVLIHLPQTESALMDRIAAVTGRAGKMPAGDTRAQTGNTTPTAPRKETPTAGLDMTVRRVLLEDISIYRGESVRLKGRMELRDLFSPNISINAGAKATDLSQETDFAATLSILLASGESPRVDGTVSLHRLEMQDILKDKGIPRTRVNLDLNFSGSIPDTLTGNLSGTLETEASKSFSGTITGQVAWKDNHLLLTNAGIDSPSLKTSGDLSFTPGAPLSLTVSSAAAQGEGLRVLLALVPLPGFRLEPKDNAFCTLGGLQLAPISGGTLGLLKGDASFGEIDLLSETGAAVLAGISGKLGVENNVITIGELRSEGVALSGTVRPDLATQQVRLELSGEMDLAVGQIGALVPKNPLSGMGGRLSVKRFAATIMPDQIIPPDIELDAQMKDGRCTLTTPGYTDRLSKLSGEFGFKDNVIQGRLAGSSERLGPVGFDGGYTPAECMLKGEIRLDIPTITASFIPDGAGRNYCMPLAAQLGNSAFDLTLQLPNTKNRGLRLQLDRQGTPPLHGSLDFTQNDGGMAFKQLDVSSEVPIQTLETVLPIPLQTEGLAGLSVGMTGTEPGMRINADLGKTVLRLNGYIAKKSGDPATVCVRIDPARSMPLQSVQIALLGETATIQPAPETLRIPDLKINLASLSPLLVHGGQLSGQLSGSVDLSPVNAALHLEGAGLALGPGMAVDSITGNIGYRHGALRCESLRVLGADSDCTFTARLQDRVIEASVDGAKLNLNALLAMSGTIAAASAAKQPAQSPSAASESKTPPAAAADPAKHITGTATVELGALYYQRGRMDNVRADIAFAPDAVTLSSLAFQADKGGAEGSAVVTYGAPNTLDASLSLSGIDLDLLDRLAFAESRGMRGTLTGPVRLRFPLAGAPVLCKGLNGSVDIKAENGTYGKIRLATELLTVLKSTEIVRLTIPRLKDEGLTFNTSLIRLQITDGRIAVEKFTITDKAYAIEGGGTVDLPADDMNVTVGFNPLQSVTGVADWVPGVKLATGLLSSGTGLRIRATGSPFNPKVRPDAGVLPIRAPTPDGNQRTDTPSDQAPKEKSRKNPVGGFVKNLFGTKE